jgi:hypothetical protein
MIAGMRRLFIACVAIVAGAIPAMARDASDVTSSYMQLPKSRCAKSRS